MYNILIVYIVSLTMNSSKPGRTSAEKLSSLLGALKSPTLARGKLTFKGAEAALNDYVR